MFENGEASDRASARYPDDARLAGLIICTLNGNPRFAQLWRDGAVGGHAEDRKTIRHPDIGEITVDCDVLGDSGTDLKIVIYTAVPAARTRQSSTSPASPAPAPPADPSPRSPTRAASPSLRPGLSFAHYDTATQQWKDLHVGDAQMMWSGRGISHIERSYQPVRRDLREMGDDAPAPSSQE